MDIAGAQKLASKVLFMRNVNLIRRSELTAYFRLTCKAASAVLPRENIFLFYQDKFRFDTKHAQ